MDNKDLYSRRQFFKHAAMSVLPVVGAMAISQMPFISQAQESQLEMGCQYFCQNGCKSGCNDTCKITCNDTCKGSCYKSCTGNCDRTCVGSCTGGNEPDLG